jgi:hypothetical protein
MIKKSNKKFHRNDEFTLEYLVNTDEKISGKKGEAKRSRFFQCLVVSFASLLQLNVKLKTLCCNTLCIEDIILHNEMMSFLA